MIESLESRKLLSYSVAYGEDQVIRIKFSGYSLDTVTTTNISSQRFVLSVNGEERKFRWKAVTMLRVDTGDGADLVDFRDLKVRTSIDGGKGGDTLYGGRRADYIYGDGGGDFMYGNEDHDTLEGGLRDDLMLGGDGDDTFIPYSDPDGDDSVFGNLGFDTVDYSTETKNLSLQIKTTGNEPADVVTDYIHGDIEYVRGGSGNDTITSFLSTEIYIDGGPGDDTITGGDGDDLLVGGSGRDQLFGGAGNDRFILGVLDGLADFVDGGSGVDSIVNSEDDPNDIIGNL